MSEDAPKKTNLIVMTKQGEDGKTRRVRSTRHAPDFSDVHHKVILDGIPYVEQLKAVGLDDGAGDGLDYVDDYIAQVQPRNPIERMMAVQMLWLHKRLGQLATMAARTTRADHLRTMYAATDSGLAAFRKHAIALQQLREPRPVQFIRANQANIADRQIVNTGSPPAPGPDSVPFQKVENELGLRNAPPSLPPVIPGSDVLAGLYAPREAVGEVHGPQDASGQGPICP